MLRTKRSYWALIFLADFLLLNAAILLMNYMRRGTWKIPGTYAKLLAAIYLIWLIVFFLARRYRVDSYRHYLGSIFFSVKSAASLAYGLCFVIVLFSSASISRLLIFGICLLWMLLAMLLLTLLHLIFGKRWNHRPAGKALQLTGMPKISLFLFLNDLVLFIFSFFVVNYLRRGSFRLEPLYPELLLLFYGLWLAISFITKKYDYTNFQNYYYALAACIKTGLLVAAIMSVLIFAFRLSYFSRFQVYGSLLILLALEAGLYYVYFLFKIGRIDKDDIESIEAMHRYLKQADLPQEKDVVESGQTSQPSHMKILMDVCINNSPNLFEFIRGAVDLDKLSDSEIALLSTQDSGNIEILPDRPFRLVINFERINGILWLNQYFLKIHKKLANGGYLVGKVDSLELHKQRFFKAYPRYYREVFYIFYFILHRVMPRIPQTQAAYFAFTKGRNRSLSRAETLGRLHFCGFKVLADKEIGESLFFVAQKAKTASLDKSPSKSLIIKLKRVGWNGQPIEIYKFRTMHPYSEFLQEYIYENHQLKEGGKIRDDFRVTEWGRFFRKYWLDEIPMIYNWLRGEIKIFGVRPLSRHFLSLYDASLQEMRSQIKPGLIPPYYADLPREFAQIVESEKKYMQAYKCHPWRTQWVYLLRSLNNILFKGARSE